ncbi:DnaJ domain-containing protein [Nocardioides ungokensis]|uniref:DnaJ domain-containing protein n=1 Tax=Nocardioides ungokensis TaxID=1643322 RepID=UPI0031B644E0
MAQDFYEVLGISRDAEPADIQRAYRRLARQHHPDVNKHSEAEERFKEIAEAYDVLSDPELRRRYDAFGEDFRRVPPDTDPAAWRQARTYADAGAGARGRWSSGAGRREVSEQATSATTSTSRTCSGASSAGGGEAVGAGPAGGRARSRAPTTRPRWRCPSKRLTTAPSAA